MQFDTGRQLHGDGLQFGCLEGDLFCSLAVADDICGNICIGETHVHFRYLRLAHAIIVEFHCQSLSGCIRTGKSVTTVIGIRRSQMNNDKLFSSGKIRMFL